MSSSQHVFLPNFTVAGQGPAIVFLHGFFMDHTLFTHQVKEFSADWTVVCIDARGHGDTPHGESSYSFWDQAEDVKAVLDHLDISEAVLVGHSQGGFIALRAALAHPSAVRALALIGSEAGPSPAAEQEGYRGLFTAWDTAGPTAELTAPLAQQIIGDPELAQHWSQRWQQRTGIPVSPAGDCLLDREDITDRLAEITCPAVLIRGDKDQAISAERAQPLVDGLPGMTAVVTVPGAAHAPQISHPETVNAALGAFLGCLERAADS